MGVGGVGQVRDGGKWRQLYLENNKKLKIKKNKEPRKKEKECQKRWWFRRGRGFVLVLILQIKNQVLEGEVNCPKANSQLGKPSNIF